MDKLSFKWQYKANINLKTNWLASCKQLGYATVTIKDERQLLSNLKTQIERANGLAPLSETEWKQVISFLNTGTVFERAKNLRDQFPVKFDDGSSKHIFFYQMIQAKTYTRSPIKSPLTTATIMDEPAVLMWRCWSMVCLWYKSSWKKRGMEIAEAFNQTQRYIREAYWAGQGLFGFIQLFVISNGANTRYYSNGTTGIEFAFPWANVAQ